MLVREFAKADPSIHNNDFQGSPAGNGGRQVHLLGRINQEVARNDLVVEARTDAPFREQGAQFRILACKPLQWVCYRAWSACW